MNDEIGSAAQTSEPIQFVADLLGDSLSAPDPTARTITDPRVAAALIAEETRSRLRAVIDRFDGVPTILLSGGVDSIYLAALAVRLGVRPHAITIVTAGDSDATGAAAAAAALGLPHDVIRLTGAEVVDLARDAMRRLGTSELWEVAAGIPLLAAKRSLDRFERVGAILTGSGADAIFGGGRSLRHPLHSAAARAELDSLIRTESAANFRYRRLVPHFHPALLNTYADKLVHVFQTVRWWRLAERLAPPALFGEHNGRRIDKLALRMACAEELPSGALDLAWRTKAPIQRSSGLFTTLAAAARSHAANLPGARTYTDPMTEDAEAVAIRLYLTLLDRK
ncbi:asparagine synthase C-terminal domain-containing protein [Nocardia sp. NBC_00508]|uniref:asparagine synthase C-terminal domain-containing protein n=1 Tax=Nocardia sp. NBC_00508 TaxID=2975992 RepID=UPI002E81FC27|nr:asparagine synthase C-terminal domain-containing protein [Nocardia sp. NBC_00508]WUD68162.1 asparagine synthase C-terminal domain-containing protein [Nocardia sp. NBC_00508]